MKFALLLIAVLLVPASARALDDGAVVYGMIPREVGGADGVTARLDALVDLGVDVVWLSPINRSPPGDFGYAITDYFSLRPDFGDERQFHHLIAEAHRRHIKVMMDLAVNHTSDRHPWFTDTNDYGYYDRDPSGAPTHYFDWVHLPNLDYDNPRVREHITRAFEHWVRDFDVDGFRLDAAWGVRDRAPEFWPSLIRDLRQIKPALIFLAEASAREPYWARSGFDCAYDWDGQLGHWAWQEAFDDAAKIAPRLRAALSVEAGCALRFLDNNDTGARFITRHGVGLTRVAAALVFTLPGLPLVYLDEEVGAAYLPYQSRAKLDESDPYELRPLYRRLIALRRRLPALRSRAMTLVHTGADDRVLAYLRTARDGSRALVLLDFGDAAEVTLPPGEWSDAWSGERVAHVRLPRFGFRVLASVR